jgi:hypothetical protein
MLSRLPLTLPHYYDFGEQQDQIGPDLVDPRAWDAVRSVAVGFELPSTRETWEQQSERTEFAERAAAIVDLADRLGARSLASYGVGGASLERQISLSASGLRLICSDFAPAATERLATLFSEADVRILDFRNEPPLTADLHLMHRIDTELANQDWRRVFERFAAERILFVPGARIDDWQTVRRAISGARRGRRAATRAGWFRTETALRHLWRRTHVDSAVPVGDLPGYLLTPRSAAGAAQGRRSTKAPIP